MSILLKCNCTVYGEMVTSKRVQTSQSYLISAFELFTAVGEKLYLYKLLTGRLVGVASRHYQPITRLVFTSCGNYFASAGEDGFVYLWSLASFNNALHKTNPPDIQPHFTLGQHSDKVQFKVAWFHYNGLRPCGIPC